jgi:tetratricopeptide (TPR) repeat protein
MSIVLVLAVLALSLYSFRSHARGTPQKAKTSNDPHVLLAEANRLAWLSSWPEAGPLYQRAQTLFTQAGDRRNALYAQIGLIRSQAERLSFVDISNFLASQLETPLVQHDAHLRLWCLVSKGMTDIEIDLATAKRDWEEARALAEALGEKGWANRTRGELGTLTFLEGDAKGASLLIGKTVLSAIAQHDVAGEIRYLSLIGQGFNELNLPNEALGFFDRAISLSRGVPDVGFPFIAYEGKAEALTALGRKAEAEAFLKRALREAQAASRQGHEMQALILLGELEQKSGDPRQAEAYLHDAAQRAMQRRYYRMAAQAMFDLAEIYRKTGNLPAAEDRLNQGIEASSRVGDRYYLPRDLRALAEVKAETGHLAEAHALYQRAEDIIDGILIHTPGPHTESSLAGAMSSIYLDDFALAARRGDVASAFTVVERVRGRTAADRLRNHSVATYQSPSAQMLEGQVSALQVRLMRSTEAQERNQLLDSLLEAEERLDFTVESFTRASSRMPFRPVSLGVAQEMLKPDEALLEYVLTEPTAFCLVLTPDRAEIISLPAGRRNVEALISSYLAAVDELKPVPELESQLYRLLLDPVPVEFRRFRLGGYISDRAYVYDTEHRCARASLAPDVSFCRLHGDVAQQELNLLRLTARRVTEAGARAAAMPRSV